MKVPVKIIRIIREHNSFLVTSHVRPDGDAIGSITALYMILKKLGKKVTIRNQGPIPSNLLFLPNAKKIKPYRRLPFRPEVALILDTPTPKRLGDGAGHLERIPVLVNIDHHQSNAAYAHYNWVNPGSSSVGEMLYHLLLRLRVKLTSSIARCLYVAMLTDMGMFQFMTSPSDGVRVLNLAAKLVRTGLVPYEIYKKVYNIDSPVQLRLLVEVLPTLCFTENRQIAYLSIPREVTERYGIEDDSNDGLVAYARDIRATRVAILFMERNGAVKVSFRSKEPKQIDVDRIAAQFGGGGHPAAAGADIPGTLKAVRPQVLRSVRVALNRAGSIRR